MSSIQTLTDALYREEIARARTMDPADKLLEGPRLFERALRVMTDGVRHEQPHLDDAAVRAVVEARLERIDALDRP
jgi:hypothetical protein